MDVYWDHKGAIDLTADSNMPKTIQFKTGSGEIIQLWDHEGSTNYAKDDEKWMRSQEVFWP